MKTTTIKAAPLPEKVVQAALIRRLRECGCLVVRINSGANKGKAGNYFRAYKIENLPPKEQSAGWPDLMAFKYGRAFGFEVKADKGKLSDAQKRVHQLCESKGVPVWTVYGLDEIDNTISELLEITDSISI